MIFKSLTVGPFQCNCIFLGCEATKEAIVIDPGDEADRIFEMALQLELNVVYLAHTHAHLDHIGATATIQKKTGAKTGLHEDDMFLCEKLSVQTAFFGLPPLPVPDIDQFLKDGATLTFGRERLNVLHTPGHTPGSVCFHHDQIGLLTGDTLFAGSVGRTDLWGGSHPMLIQSIKQKLLPFPDETPVLPGHGRGTTIGMERTRNRFLQ